jgi:hypothetical protein
MFVDNGESVFYVESLPLRGDRYACLRNIGTVNPSTNAGYYFFYSTSHRYYCTIEELAMHNHHEIELDQLLKAVNRQITLYEAIATAAKEQDDGK